MATARRPQRAAGRADFGASAGWTAAGTYVPGLGLLRAGARRRGIVAIVLFGVAVLGLTTWALVAPSSLIQLGVNTTFLKAMVLILPVIAVGWLALIVATHLLLRPRPLTLAERYLGAVLVTTLAFTVAAPLAVATRYSFDQSRFVDTVFRRGAEILSGTAPNLDAKDPWKNKPRVNILLLGGDAGRDRIGTRTDTVILASIDTRTGDTVLISLPRNTAYMPFPADSPLHEYYPDGFTRGWGGNDLEYMLTEMYPNVPLQVPPDILGPTDNLGADAVKLSVGEATGLKVDYYVLIELEGFHKLIDALGGITVNVNTWVAIGGDTSAGIRPAGALRPGPNQHLNGAEALWYARGRYGADDFQRMDRQRCVIDAVIKQANPTNMITRYEDVARQSKEIVKTDLPQEILPAIVDLSLRVKAGNTKSIVLRNGEHGFHSTDPNFDLVRARVAAAIAPPKPSDQSGPAAPQSDPKSAPKNSGGKDGSDGSDGADGADRAGGSGGTAGSANADPSTGATGAETTPIAEDLSDSCAFKPELAAAQPPAPPWDR